jgi:hypothetical protein
MNLCIVKWLNCSLTNQRFQIFTPSTSRLAQDGESRLSVIDSNVVI